MGDRQLRSWLYASRSTLAGEERAHAIRHIVAASRTRNASLGVTGVLISTNAYYAQYIEGSREDVDRIRDSILADPRHMDVRTFDDQKVIRRRFGQWSLAFSGSFEPIDTLADLVFRSQKRSGEILLMEMIRRFATGKARWVS